MKCMLAAVKGSVDLEAIKREFNMKDAAANAMPVCVHTWLNLRPATVFNDDNKQSGRILYIKSENKNDV